MSAREVSRVWAKLPPHGDGQAIGLLGGSFNPAHAGHRHISEIALRRLGLDAVWWLVTPGNPLKDRSELAPLDRRIAGARRISAHPRIQVTAVEAEIGVARSRDAMRFLKRRCPTLRFVWVMGADNLATLHRWHAWRELAQLVPFAVVDRPGSSLRSLAMPAARWLASQRIDERDAPLIADMSPPRWVFLHGPLSELSSTDIRKASAGHGER